MQVLLEDFDMSEIDQLIHEALSDDVNDLIKIADIDKETKEASDSTTDDISNILGIDNILAKLDAEDDGDDGADSNDNDTLTVKLTEPKSIEVNVATMVSPDTPTTTPSYDDLDSNNDKEVSVLLHPNDSTSNDTTTDKELDVTIRDSSDANNKDANDITNTKELEVKINNTADLEVGIKTDKNTDSNNDDDDKDTFNVRLVNDSDADKQTDMFIQRRDKLINDKDPNLQLSVCIKVVMELKESLERLISHAPNETMLVKTKYVIGNILENILSNSNMLLNDQDKMKSVVYKVFDLIISLNKYIKERFDDIQDTVNDGSKSTEDGAISKQITDVESNIAKDNNNISSSNTNTVVGGTVNHTAATEKKVPNVNKKKY